MVASSEFGVPFRRKRFRHVISLIDSIVKANGKCRILDIGGEMDYWKSLLAGEHAELPIEVTLLNLEGRAGILSDKRFVEAVGDARHLRQYEDNEFDLVHSNSVIEHVGAWPSMRAMAGEVRRLAPRYFVQTPNFWFPIEPHFRTAFFHWLPEQVRLRMLLWRGWGFYLKCETIDDAMARIETARCLSRRQFAALFPDAIIIKERFMGVTKSFMALR